MASTFQVPPLLRATIVLPPSPNATTGSPAVANWTAVLSAGRPTGPVTLATDSDFHAEPDRLAAFTVEPWT